jgi:manganese transport protein
VYLSKTEAALLTSTLPRTPSRPEPRVRRRLWPLLGPAFVAAVAYVDPGNFATNFSGGASFGYTLLWVIVAANLMAMLIQSLTAKLGLATGRDLATCCRERLPRPLVWGLWAQAEAVAIATDLAEIVGGAVALNLLFGVPSSGSSPDCCWSSAVASRTRSSAPASTPVASSPGWCRASPARTAWCSPRASSERRSCPT